MTFVKATPYARKIARQYHIDLSAVTPTGMDGAVTARDVERTRAARERTREVPVTPLALRMARSMHVDLSEVKGTGIGGKISRSDVLAAAGRRGDSLEVGERREVLTGMRRVIADRMTEAAPIPTVTLTTKVDVTRMMEMRASIINRGGRKYSVNDIVLCAVAKALRKNPGMMCAFDKDSIIYKDNVNIGMAVALDEGLIVPVIRNADMLTLDELSDKARDLARRAREKSLTPDECRGSSFTVSNLGMYGVEAFTPIINPPDAAILGVCAISDGCVVKDRLITMRKVMRICLTFDHRALDGAKAAMFNLAVREFLENPESIFEGTGASRA